MLRIVEVLKSFSFIDDVPVIMNLGSALADLFDQIWRVMTVIIFHVTLVVGFGWT